jgi:hypothetical protein
LQNDRKSAVPKFSKFYEDFFLNADAHFTVSFSPFHHDVSTRLLTEANPAIVSYHASAVKIYNAKSSLVRFKKILDFEKRSSLLL